MGINVRQKGQEGEREVATAMNAIVEAVLKAHNIPPSPKPVVQRNQNQSAVGGCDLVGTMGLAIEVKRQENLSINTWWAQCCDGAQQSGGHPVLIFRQNAVGARKNWRVITYAHVMLPSGQMSMMIRVEMDFESFLKWFYQWVDCKIREGHVPTC